MFGEFHWTQGLWIDLEKLGNSSWGFMDHLC